MILPDVNILVYAYRPESPKHERYSEWLTELLDGRAELALMESVLIGFVRVVTNPRIFADPAPATRACEFVQVLRGAARARPVSATDATWTRFADLARVDTQIRGNLVPDAFIAAMAGSHGCRVATADRGFARYDGIEWFDPGADAPA
ncbi:MAG: PIN domain-containing protein [Actinomycetia bacterium]|nr:PIN domain-containing protein [Actinomycetes bacterium]